MTAFAPVIGLTTLHLTVLALRALETGAAASNAANRNNG